MTNWITESLTDSLTDQLSYWLVHWLSYWSPITLFDLFSSILISSLAQLQRSDLKLSETEAIKKYALPNSIRVPIIRKLIETARKDHIRSQAEVIWQQTKVEKKYLEFSVDDVAFFLKADEPTMLKSLQTKLKSNRKAPLTYHFTTPKVKRTNVFKFFRWDKESSLHFLLCSTGLHFFYFIFFHFFSFCTALFCAVLCCAVLYFTVLLYFWLIFVVFLWCP